MMVFDISHWMINDDYQLSGTRKKFWVVNPMDQTDLIFKIPRVKGEIWAEIVAYEIGQLLGFKMSNYQVALRNGQYGVLSPNFVNQDREIFYEGGDLFEAKFPSFNRYGLENYTIENIIGLLRQYNLELSFVTIPFFDALVGNQDRHCDNWGIIKAGDHKSFLAPIYDNGTSLGFNLSEEQVTQRLKNDDMFSSFINRGYSLIGLNASKKPKHLSLLSFLKKTFPSKMEDLVSRMMQFNDSDLMNILHGISTEVMGDIYKDWIVKLIQKRRAWLMDWYERSE